MCADGEVSLAAREDGLHLVRRTLEVARELDFLVADAGNAGERPFEVLLHQRAHGVELHADTGNRGGVEASEREVGGAHRSKKRSTVHGHRCVSLRRA